MKNSISPRAFKNKKGIEKLSFLFTFYILWPMRLNFFI